MTESSFENNDPQSLFVKAHELHDSGKYDEAKAIFAFLVKHHPDLWQLQFSLAQVLFDIGDAQQAENHFITASKLNSSSGDIFYNLAICQKSLGKVELAIESYLKALTLDATDLDSRYNLAACYAHLDNLDAAIDQYQELLEIEENHQSALNNLAYLYQKGGFEEKALTTYQKLLALDPQHISAKHMVSALQGERVTHTPESYVQELFDSYAIDYEQSLVDKLSYNLPRLMYEFYLQNSSHRSFTKTIDLGCGTGLSGITFREVSKTMIGVDLSERMIEQAERKNVYDLLIISDILSSLSDQRLYNSELILALDVFGYIGDLEKIFSESHRISKPNALFYFSIEKLDSEEDFLLKKNGRFSHSYHYIENQSRSCGWVINHSQKIDLRKERDHWVKGLIFELSKAP
ncbi:MAG: methyltransferase domain-containing protein [Desulfobulbaceae bacterium]|nr:MAG: methyltransferase domain-containing protein [Desulfobulbaceae bacterium]